MTQPLTVIASGDHAIAAGGDITTIQASCTPCPGCEQRLLAEHTTLCQVCQAKKAKEALGALAASLALAWLLAFGTVHAAAVWAGIPLAPRLHFALAFALLMAGATAHAYGLHLRLRAGVSAALRKGCA